MNEPRVEILGRELARVPVADLRLLEHNPRRGDVAAIEASLRANGQYRPLIVNRPTMEVLVGNHTLQAARRLGLPAVDVYLVEVDEQRARQIALVDNRTSDLAGLRRPHPTRRRFSTEATRAIPSRRASRRHPEP